MSTSLAKIAWNELEQYSTLTRFCSFTYYEYMETCKCSASPLNLPSLPSGERWLTNSTLVSKYLVNTKSSLSNSLGIYLAMERMTHSLSSLEIHTEIGKEHLGLPIICPKLSFLNFHNQKFELSCHQDLPLLSYLHLRVRRIPVQSLTTQVHLKRWQLHQK